MSPEQLRAAATGQVEKRYTTVGELGRPEVRAAEDPASPIGFRGRALSYGSRTAIGNPLTWGFYEELAVGAARDAVATDDIRLLLNHDPSLLLARSVAGIGTMRLADTAGGVDVDADMAPVSYARDLAVSLARGDISGMSFHFVVREETWSTVEVDVEVDGRSTQVTCELRTLVKIGLRDVSVVTYPAYDDTDAGLRSQATATAYAAHRGLDSTARDALIAGRAPAQPEQPTPAHVLEQRAMRHRGLAARHGLQP